MNEGEAKSKNVIKKKKFRPKKNPKLRKFKKRKQKKRYEMKRRNEPRNTSPMPVLCAPYAQSFWNNYRKAMEWTSSYTQTYWKRRAIDLHQENILLKQRLSVALNTSSESQMEEISEDWNDEQRDDNDSDTYSEYEVSEEYLKFIETSLKHKASLEKSRKKEMKGSAGVDEIPSTEDDNLIAPVEDTGAKRSSEMKDLYGRESAKIHGMETAMHLGFMLKCDKNKPVVWPVLPLSHSYSSSSQL